ncbi:MAG: restriction endonuclease [Candidatus Accumulibacter sp.]|jgi:DNA modification methylase|nr:restriction endonuclease [Accumulibacter sp.]
MTAAPLDKRLYFGDNLDIVREHVEDESVDLIYLDPPFNSDADYNVFFTSPKGREKSHAQIEAFKDTWHWGDESEREFHEILRGKNTRVGEMMVALRSYLGENDTMAYLVMMTNRLLELHRVLKPTGSLYLHCDPTASHYLKVVLDGVFGGRVFANEIIWRRSTGKSLMFRRLPTNHDVLFLYRKSDSCVWNEKAAFQEYDEVALPVKTAAKYKYRDENGRLYRLDNLVNPNTKRPNLTYEFLGVTRVWRWTKDRMQTAYEAGLVVQTRPGTVPQLKRYLDEQRGVALSDVWTDIPPLNSQARERLGYPTQKPLALLERIIKLSSNEGDVILDPFCGCGTAVHAAQKLGRGWIGIDITHLAISLIEKRLKDAFPGIELEVQGTPKDLSGARDLALRDKYQFQWWACSLVDAQPYQGHRKGADGGIDGLIWFADDKKAAKKIVVGVKGGDTVSVAMVRDLVHVVERENAAIGLFVTLAIPTRPMLTEAARAGFYECATNGKSYRKIQILTVSGLLDGTECADFPDLSGGITFRKAKREEGTAGQKALL